jgi:HAD superfamily hydrolase (TIGR01549 family)
MIICFDLDGTLVNTDEWILNAMLKSVRNNGYKIYRKDIYPLWGITFRQVLKILYPKITKKEIKNILTEFEEIRSETQHLIKPFKNTKRILKKLSKDYHLAILSNNIHSKIEEVLKITKIDKKLFDMLIGEDEVRRPKPFPDEIYKAEKKFGKKVKIMVGDTKQDIKTAKAAKVKSVIIMNAPKETWKDLKKADFKIKDIKELPKIAKEVKCHNT